MRYDALEEKRQGSTVLITSNLTDVCDEPNVLNFAELSFDEKGVCDNCVIMLMKLLIRLKAKQVYVAGFDGYQKEGATMSLLIWPASTRRVWRKISETEPMWRISESR